MESILSFLTEEADKSELAERRKEEEIQEISFRIEREEFRKKSKIYKMNRGSLSFDDKRKQRNPNNLQNKNFSKSSLPKPTTHSNNTQKSEKSNLIETKNVEKQDNNSIMNKILNENKELLAKLEKEKALRQQCEYEIVILNQKLEKNKNEAPFENLEDKQANLLQEKIKELNDKNYKLKKKLEEERSKNDEQLQLLIQKSNSDNIYIERLKEEISKLKFVQTSITKVADKKEPLQPINKPLKK